MKDVQCYELFGGITLKNHAFSYFFPVFVDMVMSRGEDGLEKVNRL